MAMRKFGWRGILEGLGFIMGENVSKFSGIVFLQSLGKKILKVGKLERSHVLYVNMCIST